MTDDAVLTTFLSFLQLVSASRILVSPPPPAPPAGQSGCVRVFSGVLIHTLHDGGVHMCLTLMDALLPVFDAATPAGLIKEEYIHDCIQMDLPPGMPLSDHQTSLKLPPPDHYGQALPPPQMSAEPHGPPPVNRCTNLPLSPKGQCFLKIADL